MTPAAWATLAIGAGAGGLVLYQHYSGGSEPAEAEASAGSLPASHFGGYGATVAEPLSSSLSPTLQALGLQPSPFGIISPVHLPVDVHKPPLSTPTPTGPTPVTMPALTPKGPVPR